MPGPNSAPPRSDRVDAASLGDDPGESSSKDTQIDLSPPPGEDKTPGSSADDEAGSGDVGEFHPWDPHKAAKDIEVGDFYFKVKKNYIAAESRYREALEYKENDATATFKLAACLEKESRPEEARAEYESYLKILPYGSEAPEAKKAIERLKSPTAATPAK
jgi:tetratricopeptide (TPR) repeat protein